MVDLSVNILAFMFLSFVAISVVAIALSIVKFVFVCLFVLIEDRREEAYRKRMKINYEF